MVKGKSIIVTGAGRGIGRAIVVRLAEAGAKLTAVARTARELDETRKMVERRGGTCLAIAADVTKEAEVERVVEETIRAFGTVDGLVNNAGSAPVATLVQMEPAEFDAVVAINVRAVYLLCRAVWSSMAGRGGRIINVSSLAADDPFPGFAAYGGSKAFVSTFSKALDAEGAPHGIRVYCVAPGAVETQMLRKPFPDFPADKVLSPDDVAVLVETLLGPAGSYLGGSPIRIKKL